MIDLFYECEDPSAASYADDTAPYSCATDMPSVALELQASATKLFLWFKNPGKSHILLSSKKPEIVSVDGISIAASSHEKLLGVIIDSELKFENHITEICLKASKKINALCRISSFMSLEKRRTLMKAFIESQFNYCPLIWMFHSRSLNNKINRIHERALRTVYSDYNSSFNELLDKDGSFTIHQRNVQSLATEIYKYLHGLSPAILNEVFKVNETIPYDLRMRNELYVRNPKTLRYGTETISFLSLKIWSLIPQNIKDFGSLPCFKKKKNIRKWKPNCPCRLYKNIFATCWFHIAQQQPALLSFILFFLFSLFEVDATCAFSY